ncbi:hypothetical protein Acsp01_38130 [Actinoplanes sp. NBRC 101535]|nr:hypothetical protein Acsp01_38130 [Actinoplanes sp. NBRC 101535]
MGDGWVGVRRSRGAIFVVGRFVVGVSGRIGMTTLDHGAPDHPGRVAAVTTISRI